MDKTGSLTSKGLWSKSANLYIKVLIKRRADSGVEPDGEWIADAPCLMDE